MRAWSTQSKRQRVKPSGFGPQKQETQSTVADNKKAESTSRLGAIEVDVTLLKQAAITALFMICEFVWDPSDGVIL